MTGIERLRMLAEIHRGNGRMFMANYLSGIADQIEREHADDREAIAWVREHGGVDELTRMFQDADNRRVELCAALGIDLDKGWSEAMAAMRPRLMPEGMEWPTVDGRKVDFKTPYQPSLGVLEAVSIYSNGACEIMSHDGIVKNVTEIHVFKPKVLDADGVEVHKGDEVWSTTGKFDGKRTVSSVYIDPDELPYATFEERQKPYSCLCCYLTHRAPVPAADGEPLEAGQTVWDTNGDELVIGAIEDGGHTVTCRYADVGDGIPAHGMWSPSDLTHQRPVLDADGVPIRKGDTVYGAVFGGPFTVTEVSDKGSVFVDAFPDTGMHGSMFTHAKPDLDTWERIEEDARGLDSGVDRELFTHTHEDLVRRCRALAERERGE